MAFATNCTNKGCMKYNEPFLDTSSNDVICSECNRVIVNIPIFTKNLMKTLGQVKKSVKVAFSVNVLNVKMMIYQKLTI